jgi:hypothetical protein
MTCGGHIDEGKSAVAEANPVLKAGRLTASRRSGKTAISVLGKNVSMEILFRIDQRNSFIVRASVAHDVKASLQPSRVGSPRLKTVISGDSTHFPYPVRDGYQDEDNRQPLTASIEARSMPLRDEGAMAPSPGRCERARTEHIGPIVVDRHF